MGPENGNNEKAFSKQDLEEVLMEPRDEELIAQLALENEELKELVEKHQAFENRLEEFNKRPYLTTEEQVEKKNIQKQKLAGKDRIVTILAEYRKSRQENET